MLYYYVDIECCAQPSGHTFGTIDGAMLSAGASEGDHQVVETALYVALYIDARSEERV